MKTKPVILITPSSQRKGAEFADTSCSLSNSYPCAILAAGGVPWILPCLPEEDAVAEAIRRCNGVMLTGGDDVQPRLYASQVPAKLMRTVAAVDPARDLTEFLVIREVLRQRKPLLAICRGQQILNVAFGGSLLVDIRTQIPCAIDHNRSDRKDRVVHKVALTPGCVLTKITGKQALDVNSSHHQAVRRVAKPLRVTAVSPDGIVEALELAESETDLLPWLLAVQYHPERLFDQHRDHLELFRSFARACNTERKQSV